MAKEDEFQYFKLFFEKNNLVTDEDDSPTARQFHLMCQLLALTEMVIYKLYDGDLILTQCTCSIVIWCLFEYAATQIAVELCRSSTAAAEQDTRTPHLFAVQLIALTKEWIQEQTKHLLTPWVTTEYFRKESRLLQHLSNHILKISNQTSFHDLISINIGCLGGTDSILLERQTHIEHEPERKLDIETCIMKPYLYKWTKLKARFNFLTGLTFVTRQSSATETDIGTVESIAKIIVLLTNYRAKILHIPEKVFKLQIARLCNCNETDFDLRNWRSILPLIVNSLEPLSYSEMWRIKNPQKNPPRWLTTPMLRTPNWWPLKVEKLLRHLGRDV